LYLDDIFDSVAAPKPQNINQIQLPRLWCRLSHIMKFMRTSMQSVPPAIARFYWLHPSSN